MSQLDKLIERIRRRPPEANFDDVRRLLEAFGWTMARQKGSHVSFTKRGDPRIFTVSLERGRKVKRVYLDKLCDLLGLDD